MNENSAYARAVIDFQDARHKADLQTLLSFLTRRNNELLSYEDVRQKLSAIEGTYRTLEDIPLKDIIGSVERYTDFNRNFLPRKDGDQDRWARVMAEATGMTGLPAIEVYKIGGVFFVLDGNHRVSVARQLGATHIQAYVKEVYTSVPINSDLKPDDLILMAEQVDFLEKTQLNTMRPDSDLALTLPGRYPVLLEHIVVHQYFMGIDEQRRISYAEAVVHWYDQVYVPIVKLIRERGILRFFKERTEADLYIWLAKHREILINELGWHVEADVVAEDLVNQYAPGLLHALSRMTGRILDAITIKELDSGPQVGSWRQKNINRYETQRLFRRILVGISKDDEQWDSLHQAIVFAHKERSLLHALYVVPKADQVGTPETDAIVAEFHRRCKEADITGDIAIEVGDAGRQICKRAQWSDMVIGKLTHPPADRLLARLSSGFRIMVQRCSRPILAVPEKATSINKALLAYNGNPKADEALFIASYMANRWQLPLVVLTVGNDGIEVEAIQNKARAYLSSSDAPVEFKVTSGSVVDSILQLARQNTCDLILIGGYNSSPMVEIVRGSLTDKILRETAIPTLICR